MAQRGLKVAVRCGLGAVIAVFASAPHASGADPDSHITEFWNRFNAEKAAIQRKAEGGDLAEWYFNYYRLDGVLAACEALGNAELARFLVTCADKMIATGRDHNGDGYLDYYNSAYGTYDDAHNGKLFPWKSWRPVPRLVRVLKLRFSGVAEFDNARARLLPFVERHLIAKWRSLYETLASRNFSRGTIHIMSNYAEMLIDAYLVTDKAEYRALAEKYCTAVRNQMVSVDGAYVWNQVMGDRRLIVVTSGSTDGAHVSDTSHGGVLLSLVELAYRAGIVFSDADAAAWVKTRTSNLWRADNRPLHDFVDGRDWTGDGGAGRYGWHPMSGWAKLGMFSPTIRVQLDRFPHPSSDRLMWHAYQIRNFVFSSADQWRLSATATPPPATQPPPAMTNLAPNPGFESDPTADYFTHGAGTFTWATDAAHSGTRSLKIVSSQPQDALARWLSKSYSIPATPGTTYRASVWLKTSGVQQYGRLTVNFLAPDWVFLGRAHSSPVSGTTGWTQRSVQGTAPPGTTHIRVEFRLFGPGTLWADDVVLSR